jgi:Rieske 2Fe-2S protein
MDDTTIAVKPRDVMPDTARTLPARYYADPALFQRELDGLFGRMWFCAGRSEEVARAGQFVLRQLNGYNVIVTRSQSGRVQAFHNVCRHRGSCARKPPGSFPGAFSAPTTRGRTISTVV